MLCYVAMSVSYGHLSDAILVVAFVDPIFPVTASEYSVSRVVASNSLVTPGLVNVFGNSVSAILW